MRNDAQAAAWLAELGKEDRLLVWVVTNAEIRYGIRRIPVGRRSRALERAYDLVLGQLEESLEVTRPVSETYAEIKAGLESQGTILPENDLWIAATALVHQSTLVTNDRHFGTVPGLQVED